MKRIGLTLLLLAICQSAPAQLPNRILNSERRLPTSFYSDLADESVSTIRVPQGRYNLSNGDIVCTRSDITIDGNGSTLVLRPSAYAGSSLLPIQFVTSQVDAGFRPSNTASRLDGAITPSTTSLVMHAGENVPVEAGEEVEIQAGVNWTDPAEAERNIKATVESVSFSPGGGSPHDGTNSNGTFAGSMWVGNGTNAKITTGYLLNRATTSDFNVTAQIKTSSGTGGCICCDSIRNDDSNLGWKVGILDAGNVYFILPVVALNNAITGDFVVTPLAYNDGVLHTITAEYEGGVAKLYVDQELRATKTLDVDTSKTLSTASYGFLIGANYNNSNSTYSAFYTGSLANLGVCSGARTAEQIAALHVRLAAGDHFAELAASHPELVAGSLIWINAASDVLDKTNGLWTITFTEALGQAVTQYGSVAAVKAATDPSNYSKVDDSGEWGVDLGGAINRGTGDGSGLVRFVGGAINHGITFKNWRIETQYPGSDYTNYPTTSFLIYAADVDDFTLENIVFDGIVGSGLHTSRAFNTTLNGITATGLGAARQPSGLIGANLWSSWGAGQRTGENITMYATTNIGFCNFEVADEQIDFSNLTFSHCTFDSSGLLNDNAQFLGLFNTVYDTITVNGATVDSITISLNGSSPTWWQSSDKVPTFSGTVEFTGSVLPVYLELATAPYSTLKINSVPYGPKATDSHTYNLTISGSSAITLPTALYKSISVTVTSGTVTNITEAYGTSHTPTLNVPFSVTNYTHIQPGSGGGSYTDFLSNLTNALVVSGSGSVSVKIDVEYYPASGAHW